MGEMIGIAEEFYTSLNIPYRVVSVVSGALNDAAARKYDIEAWFPASQAYRELVSCSNCTDYQARNLGIRIREPMAAPSSSGHQPAGAHKGSHYVHMVNSTLTASQRTLCCVIENHQEQEGVRIPEPLRPFMMGMDFIPYRVAANSVKKFAAQALRGLH
eukprot:gene22065-29130_t